MKSSLLTGLFLLFGAAAAPSATLTVTASDQIAGNLVDYTYSFAVSGASAGIDNIYLGSNDLSPVNLAITVDGAPTVNWSFLSNNTPQNYLQFFSTNGSSLNNGDVLGVTFASTYGPGTSEFAIGLNSSTGIETNEVTPLVGPTAVLTPEPASAGLFAIAGAALFAVGLAAKARRAA